MNEDGNKNFIKQTTIFLSFILISFLFVSAFLPQENGNKSSPAVAEVK